MAVLDRASLEQSPLADLHVIASELSLDGYRRLRKDDLIDAILERQGGDGAEPATRRRRGRRGGRGRRASAEGEPSTEVEAGEEESADEGSDDASDRAASDGEASDGEASDGEASDGGATGREQADHTVEGVIELLPNGSAFIRVDPPDPSDDDVYVSPAQVKRLELVSGDRVSGPRRTPRRSERFASLLRIDTVNGQPAEELGDGTRFDDLPATFPSERLSLESDDLTLTAIAELAPIGRGSRVTIAGLTQSGKTEVLRRLASVLGGHEDLRLWLVLAGVRPEEIWEWRSGPLAPAVSLAMTASPEAQGQAVEAAVEQARRLAARGANAVVLIDTLEAMPGSLARRLMASARKLADGGSLTVIATASAPVGGETTVIGLDAALARVGQFPALDPAATWTMRRELLAG